VEFDQAVEYVGADDDDLHRFHGHPGRIFDVSRAEFGDVYVSFVNGPSIACRPRELRPLSEPEYCSRGRRLVGLRHPLDDRPVRGLMLPGHDVARRCRAHQRLGAVLCPRHSEDGSCRSPPKKGPGPRPRVQG
jgi:hypothetical protein